MMLNSDVVFDVESTNDRRVQTLKKSMVNGNDIKGLRAIDIETKYFGVLQVSEDESFGLLQSLNKTSRDLTYYSFALYQNTGSRLPYCCTGLDVT